MPSNRSERKQRHLAQVKQSTGKAQKGKKVTENVPGSGYRETQYIGGKKYYSPLSTDPNLSITGGSSTNITISGGSIAAPSGTSIHSELQNLSTDDHTQYVHNTVARTISAVHTFSGNVVFSATPQINDLSVSNPSSVYTSLNHDSFTGFVANEHIDWTNTSSNFSTSGTVGGGVATFTSVKSPSLTTAASTAMTINPTTDLILNPTDAIIVGKNSPSNPVNISSDPFSSGFTGAGWRLTPTSFETTDMVLRGTLSVYELLIQQVRATNGSIFVSATGKVATVNSQTEVVFEDPSGHSVTPFAVNDILLMQRVSLDSSSVVKRIFAKVTNVNGLTLTLGAVTGAPSNTGNIEEGDEFVRIGNTNTASRQGGVYLTADDSGAPFIDIFSGVTSYATWNSTDKVKARLGRLDGITDSDAGLSGSQSNYFGLYSNNVHLKGTIFAQDGEIGGWDITSSAISAVVDGNTKVALEKDGDVKIFSDLDGSTRHGLFLFETGGNHLSDWWTIFHDDDSTNSGEFVFNYEGSNKFKITRTGEVNQPANTEFKITNDRVRLTIDQDDTGYYEIYGTDTGVAGDQTLGGIRWYTSESGTYGSAWNASITARVQTAGEMGLVFRAGGDTTATDYYWNFHFQGGSYNGGNTTAWDQLSDERVKENKVSIGDGLNIIKNLNPISYKFKQSFLTDSHLKDVKRWGFNAQEFKTVIPEAVSTTAEYGYDDFHSLNVDMLIPMLVAAVKELSAKVEALEG